MGNLLVVATRSFAADVARAFAPAFTVLRAHSLSEAQRVVAERRTIATCALSLELPGARGLEVVRAIDAMCPGVPRFAIARRAPTTAVLRSAFELAVAIVPWPVHPSALRAYLAQLDARTRSHVERVLRAKFDAETGSAGLTSHQSAVCWLSTLGASSKENAEVQGVAFSTVRTHQAESLKKLKLASIDALRWKTLRTVLPELKRQR